MANSLEQEIAIARQARSEPVPRNPRAFGDFALRVAQVIAILGAICALILGFVYLFRGELLVALVGAPLSFFMNVALATAFGRARTMR